MTGRMTFYTRFFSSLVLFLTLVTTDAASKDDWKTRTIYQIVTDRFARADNAQAECDPAQGRYCGGDYLGIIDKLDYIQDLGFTAVRETLPLFHWD